MIEFQFTRFIHGDTEARIFESVPLLKMHFLGLLLFLLSKTRVVQRTMFLLIFLFCFTLFYFFIILHYYLSASIHIKTLLHKQSSEDGISE